MDWNELKYGNIIYGKSTSVRTKYNGYQLKKTNKNKQFEQNHFIVILTDSVFNKLKGTRTNYHLGVALSKMSHGKEDIEIDSIKLPSDIKKHFGSSLESKCFLVITNPVIVQKSKIEKYSESHVNIFCKRFGIQFCDYLCESRELLKETLFKNMKGFNLPNINTVSGKCSCNDCGCLNPYEAKLVQGETTLSVCPNHLIGLQDYVADFNLTKQNIECLKEMQLKYARMEKGEFSEGENEGTKVKLKIAIEDCRNIIKSEGAYCHEIKIN